MNFTAQWYRRSGILSAMATLVHLSVFLTATVRANSDDILETVFYDDPLKLEHPFNCALMERQYPDMFGAPSLPFVDNSAPVIGLDLDDVNTRMAYIRLNKSSRGFLARSRMMEKAEILTDAEGHSNIPNFPGCYAAEINSEKSQRFDPCSNNRSWFTRHPIEDRRMLAQFHEIAESDVSLLDLDDALTAGLVNATAHIFRRMKSIAMKSLEEEVQGAVVTVPVYFNEAQRGAIQCAGAAAGLHVLRLLRKPVAAAYGVGVDIEYHDYNQEEHFVLEVNIGDRGIDVTIMNLDLEIYDIYGAAHDGSHGREWVTRLVADSLAQREELYQGTSSNDSFTSKRSLEEKVHSAMDTLRTMPAVDVEVSHNSFWTLTRDYVEGIVMPPLSEVVTSLVHTVLERIHRNKTDLSELLLSGQSAQISGLQTMLEKHLNISTVDTKDVDPEYAAAIGAAMHAAIMTSDDACLGCMMDEAERNLGIQVAGGSIVNLIHSSSFVPVRRIMNFTTYHDAQTRVDLKIYVQQVEEAPAAVDILSLDVPPAMRGTPRIEVTFVLDDTQFHAEALHVESGKIESLTRSKDELNTTLDTSRLKQNGGEVVVADTLLLSDGAVDEL